MVRAIVGTLVEVGRGDGANPSRWLPCSSEGARVRRARRPRRTGSSSSVWIIIRPAKALRRLVARRCDVSLEQLLAWIPAGHPDQTLARQIKFDRLPAHVAIIMDGNGRWAAQRHLPRVEGHRAASTPFATSVETAARLGIQVLTLYAFSVENWKRPAQEVGTLMLLLKRYLRSELKRCSATTSGLA